MAKNKVKHAKKKQQIEKGILLVILVTLLNGFGQLFQKLGMESFDPSFFGLLTNYQLILGLGFYGVSVLILTYALKFGDLSLLFPFVSLTFVWVLLLSGYVLHEPVSLFDFGGIVLIVGGVSLVGR